MNRKEARETGETPNHAFDTSTGTSFAESQSLDGIGTLTGASGICFRESIFFPRDREANGRA